MEEGSMSLGRFSKGTFDLVYDDAVDFRYWLPDELILKILDELAWDGSDPYIPVGHDCPWTIYTKTRKAVTLVCRRWWLIGLSYLYSIIYIHRIGQLTALANTLKASKAGRLQGGIFTHRPQEGYGPWVRCIYLQCYIPRIWHDVYRREVLEVLCLCSELRSFANKPLWDGNTAPAPELSFFWAMQGHTTTLPIIYSESGTGRLSIFDKLTTLRIHIDIGAYNPSYNTSGIQQILVLRQLEFLFCDVHSYRAYENLASIAGWKLPKLRSLSLYFTWKEHRLENNLTQAIKLFEAFGAELRYLLFDNNTLYDETFDSFSGILKRCPKLETLVYDCKKTKEMDVRPSFVHKSLRRVELLWTCHDLGVHRDLDEHIRSFTNSLAFPEMEIIVMQDPRFTNLPVTRAINYETSDGYFSVLGSLIGFLQEAGISFLNRNEEPITISQEPNDDIDDSEELDDLDESEDSSYCTDKFSDATDTETESEGELDTEDFDGNMLTSEGALELFESMQYYDSEDDDLLHDEREEGDIADDILMDVGD